MIDQQASARRIGPLSLVGQLGWAVPGVAVRRVARIVGTCRSS